jgi:hypothetical protein
MNKFHREILLEFHVFPESALQSSQENTRRETLCILDRLGPSKGIDSGGKSWVPKNSRKI